MKDRSTQVVGETLLERANWLWRGGRDTLEIARRLNISEPDAERLVHQLADARAAANDKL